jgi:HEAT repeat protein
MAGSGEFFWRLLPDVRGGERSRFLFFASLFTLITLAQTVGLAGSEALFLAEFGAARLPPTFIAAAVTTVLISLLYAVRVGEVRNDLLYIHMLLFAGVVLLAATGAVLAGSIWVLPAIFCVWYATQAIFQNHFWTFSGDYFDTLASKRLVPLFTIGSSVGGVLGGILAAVLTRVAGPVSLIAAWGVALAGAALMLRLGRRPLRRWGPLELEEADETSVEGMQGALRYLRRSSLARWLVVSALGMVLAFFLAQYLYSDVFAKGFPDPADLAAFLAIYFAVTNAIEILFEVSVTPWLIRRIGVGGANLVHPVLMILSFGGLAWRYGIPAGIGARASRELMDNAMAAPIRSLIYNAMPARFRGRMRAFMEGIVVYAGMAVAGFVLLLVSEPDPVWLSAAGIAAALFYLLANWMTRRAYLRTLVRQLRAGRLDLDDVGDAIGTWEVSRLAALWEVALRQEGRRPSASLLQLIPALADRGIVDPLVRAASHPDAEVRRSSVNALASIGGGGVTGPLALALDDPDSGVRLAALRGLSRADAPREFLATRLRDLLEDDDPTVRAEAAARAGPEGSEILVEMISASEPREATAALRVAPPALLDAVLGRTRAEDPQIRAAALECAARLAPKPPLALEDALSLLSDPSPAVRRTAILLLANLEEEEALQALAGCLTDPSSDVHLTAEAVLTSLGEEGVAAVEPYLGSEVEQAVEAALRVTAASGVRGARQALFFELRRHVRDLWFDLAAYQKLPSDQSLAARFLRIAYQDAMLRSRRLAFHVLSLLENPSVIQNVDRELRAGTERSRGDALEVLSNLGDREAAHMLVLVYERAPLEERIRALSGFLAAPADLGEILTAARGSGLRWLRIGAQALEAQEGDPPPEEELMERLLALKQVDLFANLSLEQLEAVHQLTREAEYLPGEVIIGEGERGETLYLILEGRVSVVKSHGTQQELKLGSVSAVGYFGEMAILDDAPRSATVVADTRCRVLTLDGASLKDLILQMPEISFVIFRVLTGRVRAADAKLAKR